MVKQGKLRNSYNIYRSGKKINRRKYASFPDSKVERPRIALKAFKRVFVPKGETVTVTLPVNADDLRYWDVSKHAFVLEKGKIGFFVEPSSADQKLKGEFLAE